VRTALGALLLALWAAGPQCEQRGPGSDGGFDGSHQPRLDGRVIVVGDGSVPVPGDGGFPGSGRDGDPGTDVLFLVRMDRGLANDAALYEKVVGQTGSALVNAGLVVAQTAVASLQDGRLLWGKSKGVEPPVGLAAALTYYAQHLPDLEAPCSTTGLAQLGANIPVAVLNYPSELTGVPFTEWPFTVRPGALLVVLIDHDLRPSSPSAAECAVRGSTPTAYFGAQDPVPWLSWWWLSRPQTRFWAISTPEDGTSRETARALCLAAGFPQTALDVIAPSAVPFYEPWAQGMNAFFPGLVERIDFCTATTAGFPAQDYADAWAKVLRAQVGLP